MSFSPQIFSHVGLGAIDKLTTSNNIIFQVASRIQGASKHLYVRLEQLRSRQCGNCGVTVTFCVYECIYLLYPSIRSDM